MLEIPWLLFVGTSLMIIVAPGQDMVLVMSRGMGIGAAAGIATGAGVGVGLLGHTVLATLGLGALLEASEFAYTVLRYVGVLYLLYLGLRLIFSGGQQPMTSPAQRASLVTLFCQGAFSNLSNPKVALFYFAFLPQFVPADATNTEQLIFVLGVVFALLTFLIKVPVGYFAGLLSNWLQENPRVLGWIYRSSGAMLIGLGLKLAFEEKR